MGTVELWTVKLDYAANAVGSWTAETLRIWFEADCERRRVDPEKRITDAFNPMDGADAYWDIVRTNLAAGKQRESHGSQIRCRDNVEANHAESLARVACDSDALQTAPHRDNMR